MSFRENLREAIDYCGLGQKELAHKTKISLRSIENYLRENNSIPLADKAVQLAQVLGVTVEYLVTGMDSPKKNPALIEPEIDNEIRQLIKAINNLPKAKQRIVIKSALHLVEVLRES